MRAAADRAPVMIAADAHLDPRFKAFPNLPEDDYASILAVPILAREKLEGALNVRTREPRAFTQAEVDLLMTIAGQVAQSIEHAKLYSEAQRRVHELEALARISEAVSESLYLEESLEAIVKTTVESTHATGAAIVLEDGRIAWPEGRAGVRTPCGSRCAGAAGRSASSSSTATRVSPTTTGSCSRRSRARRPSRSSTAAWRCAACWPRRSTTASRTTCRRSPRCCGLQARAENVDPQKALGDSVNRILAIAAVHEVLTEQREDDVELDELIDRLRAMLVQGLVVGKDVSSTLEPGLARRPAGDVARARVQRASRQRARARWRSISITLPGRDGDVVLAIADDGDGMQAALDGTGLSIVRALVRDELGGELTLVDDRGLRAEVRFPARAGKDDDANPHR